MQTPQILSELGATAAEIRRDLLAAGRTATFASLEPGGPELSGSQVPRLLREMTRNRAQRRPSVAVPVVPYAPARPADAASIGTDTLAATWLGHATVLVEIGGRRVLFDPVVEERVSPSRLVGPRRLHPAPAAVADLGPIDAVVVSHDHYDHLERRTIVALAGTTSARFVVPLGIGSHLRRWGVAAERIDELEWGDDVEVAGVRIGCTQARHFSGRTLRRDTTLWASWTLRAGERAVYFGGDTGYAASFARVGADHGPFDLTVLPIGAYDVAWRDIHMDPEEAVRAHRDLGGQRMLPVHWATFDLAFHPWDEPIERLLAAGDRAAGTDGVEIGTPRPGERWDLGGPAPLATWWRANAAASLVE